MSNSSLFLLVIVVFVLACSGCSGDDGHKILPDDARVLAFGDSLTYGTGVSKSFSYPVVLESLIHRKVISAGVPGEVSSAGLLRLKSLLKKDHFDLVIICHGGNDILRRLNASDTERNLRQMISLVREQGAEVMLVAVPKFGLFPRPASYYETIESSMKIPVEWDVLSSLEANPSKKSDQVHFNEAGYREMAEAIAALMRDKGFI